MSVVLSASPTSSSRVPASRTRSARTPIYNRRAAERTAAVTAQLLAFGRRQVLRPQLLGLNGVTGLPLRCSGAPWAKTRPVSCCPSPCDTVPRRSGQLEQVLLNLALNAQDAMPRGGRLSVETDQVDPDSGIHRFQATSRAPGTVRAARGQRHGAGHGPTDLWPALSIRSSPPRGSAKALGLASPPSTAS